MKTHFSTVCTEAQPFSTASVLVWLRKNGRQVLARRRAKGRAC